jgi:hypothetical protein
MGFLPGTSCIPTFISWVFFLYRNLTQVVKIVVVFMNGQTFFRVIRERSKNRKNIWTREAIIETGILINLHIPLWILYEQFHSLFCGYSQRDMTWQDNQKQGAGSLKKSNGKRTIRLSLELNLIGILIGYPMRSPSYHYGLRPYIFRTFIPLYPKGYDKEEE